MLTPEVFLIILIIIGVVGRVTTISVAASILFILRSVRLDRFFPMLERRSLELGLLFLMISILVPLASGKIGSREMVATAVSLTGALTILGGIAATVLNAKGLALLQAYPSLLVCVIIGSVIGIVFFRGMPIGPLMACALAAFFLAAVRIFF